MNIIQACWLESSYCEYCPGKISQKTYLPLTKSTLNPAHICEECATEHTVVGWFDNWIEYMEALQKVKQESL